MFNWHVICFVILKIYIKLSVAPSNDITSLIENNFIDLGIIEDAKNTNDMLIKPFYQQELMLDLQWMHLLPCFLCTVHDPECLL